MKFVPDDLTIEALLDLKSQQMLVVNPEYQRGSVWTPAQKKKLVDSVLRGYPIPLLYLHHIRQTAGKLVSERYEVIDGQQRINALSEYRDGAFRLFDPVADEEEARFPSFIKKQPCVWGGKSFADVGDELRTAYLQTSLRVVRIETHNANEARDLFVRLQAGMPLNSQEKRDAWPGQFTDFILKLGGKTGIDRYPGHDFFNVLLGGRHTKDRGKIRQLAAQIAVLYFSRRDSKDASFSDINAAALDDFYYEHLGFDANSDGSKRLWAILDKITALLRDQKRPKLLGYEAIHLVLLVDSLFDEYTRSWEARLAHAFDTFRQAFAHAKKTVDDANPSEYWLRYGVLTRVNSDRGDSIQKRHDFFSTKMRELIQPDMKDPKRLFGPLEKEVIYYRDKKRCAVCDADVAWHESEFHHVDQHYQGGKTVVENGVLVHQHCHPKGSAADKFAAERKVRSEV